MRALSLLMVCVFGVGWVQAFAQSCPTNVQYVWHTTVYTTPDGDAQTVCGAFPTNAGGPNPTYSYYQGAGTPSLPSSSTDTGNCDFTQTYTSGQVNHGTSYGVLHAIATTPQSICKPNACAALAGKTVNASITSGTVPAAPGASAVDANGCVASIKTQPVSIVGCHGGCEVVSATYTGASESSPPSGTPPAGNDCVSSAAGSFCSEASQGKNCGTVNGDEVCVDSIPPGTCQSYASGGVACTVASGASASSPPAPNNGTAGTAATPVASVAAAVTSNGTTVTETTNYYSATTVQGSTVGVAATPGGLNVGNAGTGSGLGGGGTSGGTGSAPSAANGDCGASGVECGTDAATPTLPNEPTIAQSTQTYTSALNQVPIVAAVSGIAASVPSGQCPTASLSLFGHDFVMDAQCTLWADLAPLLSVCFLAMWTFIGVRIVMSA